MRVWAQVHVTPSSAGMPAAGFAQQVISWLAQLALWGSLASILVGAGIWGLSQNSGSVTGAIKGKQMALAGVIGAFLAGVAPSAINLVYRAAGA